MIMNSVGLDSGGEYGDIIFRIGYKCIHDTYLRAITRIMIQHLHLLAVPGL